MGPRNPHYRFDGRSAKKIARERRISTGKATWAIMCERRRSSRRRFAPPQIQSNFLACRQGAWQIPETFHYTLAGRFGSWLKPHYLYRVWSDSGDECDAEAQKQFGIGLSWRQPKTRNASQMRGDGILFCLRHCAHWWGREVTVWRLSSVNPDNVTWLCPGACRRTSQLHGAFPSGTWYGKNIGVETLHVNANCLHKKSPNIIVNIRKQWSGNQD